MKNILKKYIQKIKSSKNLDEKKCLAQEFLETLIQKKDTWIEEKYYHPNLKQGFSGWVIHEERDHSLCLVIQSWSVHKGAPPHNHGTWSVTAGVIGEEEHIIYHPIPYPYPSEHKLSIRKTVRLKPGTMLSLEKYDLHSVKNNTQDVSLSMSFYGKHPNYTKRVQIDAETYLVDNFICEEEN
jgi:predicted metal-dependent enzyme (double-stranded beta helix superfamily)